VEVDGRVPRLRAVRDRVVELGETAVLERLLLVSQSVCSADVRI
jgi:hypothetical protein